MNAGLVIWWLAVGAGLGPVGPSDALTLEQAVAEARTASPAARRALAVRRQAEAAAERTRPRLRPDLTFTAGGQTRAPQVRDPAPPNAIVERDLSARAAVTARQTLWHFGAPALNRRADAAQTAAAADYDAALATLRRDVSVAWYDYLAARGGFAVADEGVRRAESQLQRVKDLAALEKVAEVDVLHAEAGVLEARSARIEAANGLDLALANLNRLLGAALDRRLQPAEVGDPPDRLPPLADAVAYAQAHRPEMIALLARRAEARAGADFARAERLPTLAATGTAATQTADAFRPGAEAVVGLEVRWPLSRADDAAGRQAAEAENAATLADLAAEELRAGIALEVRRARRDWESARQRLELAEARTAANTEAHRIKVLQYERNRATLLEVSEALLERSRSELDRDRARYDIFRAAAAFELATARPIDEWPTEE